MGESQATLFQPEFNRSIHIEARRECLSASGKRDRRPLKYALCSQPRLSRLLAALAQPENREGLRTVLLELARCAGRLDEGRRRSELVLNLDSLPLEVFGHQSGSAWNGHYRCHCYHPVVVRWDRGPFLAAELRKGQAHTAEGALGFVAPMLLRAKAYAERMWLRMDAGRGSPLAARTRPPRRKLTAQDSFFLDHFFLLTNVPATEMAAEALLQHYRARDAAEKNFGEWQHSLGLSLASTPRRKSHYHGQAVSRARFRQLLLRSAARSGTSGGIPSIGATPPAARPTSRPCHTPA